MVLYGIIGLALILFAWLYETILSIRKHKVLIDLKFASLYFVAMIFLGLYSLEIQDKLFLTLNIILGTFIAGEIVYTIYFKKFRK